MGSDTKSSGLGICPHGFLGSNDDALNVFEFNCVSEFYLHAARLRWRSCPCDIRAIRGQWIGWGWHSWFGA